MIDSINFIIRNISYISFNYLKMLGIEVKKFDNENGQAGYSFVYEDIHFQFYTVSHIVILKANAHKVLHKRDITISDKETYKTRLNQVIQKVFNDNSVYLELNRIDYCVDICLEYEIKYAYISLYKLHNPTFGYMKIENEYPTSVYRQTKKGQFTLNIYSRYEVTLDKRDKKILRLELQMKKTKLKKELQKNGIDKNLDNYWSIESMREYYFEFLKGFFGMGEHYKLSLAEDIIDTSSYSNNYKRKLKKFLVDMSKERNHKKLVKNKSYSIDTIKAYIQKLGTMSINSLCLKEEYNHLDKLPNLLEIAKDIAEREYYK